MRRVVLAALAALLVVAGCAKPADPAAPPAGMEGTWIGNTPALRTVTFGHGVMTTDQAGMQGEYEVRYTATDGATGAAAAALAPLTTVRSVRVEGVNKLTGRSLSIDFTVIGGTVLQDPFGALQKKRPHAGG